MPIVAFALTTDGDLASPLCLILFALVAVAIGAGNLTMSRESTSRLIGGMAAVILGVAMVIFAVTHWFA
ncbi:hypothetical protein [Phytomonospora endophytica]|uniref:Lipopolysaccharide export LptBFGC system permease protein LptF n=1 Tax=Phytomonospora endophytica TaxID=714109 RepID=A0A841G4B1_9ACTN|nr:hypothetical protein [Phytomonospora endophytica]MBB6038950.1 lipopolysaccharide export LptBFGC system permease protein LptF [Phytomonospora endophytica]GIG67946.1 hypothetical protein Pen01_42410 [Phytomonospora endophytica]